MSDSLFTIPECKSPRLQWIEENGIKTEKSPNDGAWYAVIPKDSHQHLSVPDCAMLYRHTLSANRLATGKTEDDALTNLAKAIGLRLWNERGLP